MSRLNFRFVLHAFASGLAVAACDAPQSGDEFDSPTSGMRSDTRSTTAPSDATLQGGQSRADSTSGDLASTADTTDVNSPGSTDAHSNDASTTLSGSGTTPPNVSTSISHASDTAGPNEPATANDSSTTSAAPNGTTTDNSPHTNDGNDYDAGTREDGASGPLLAFPGAQGFGRNTTGGRGGQVVHVTNLNDAGAGSFRDAVSQPNRIVVFDTGGVIHLDSRVVIQSNITVAGQTAPGGGITLYGNGVALNGDNGGGNVILRYLRIRMGKNGDSGKDALSISLGENYIFDHLSISWGRDGTLDVNGTPIDNLSFQDCIVAQGINSDNHSTGGLIQPWGVEGHWSMIRSLYIDNKTRNPKARGRHEFINNVLYNWAEHGYIMGDTTNGESHANVIGNTFIYGPSTNANSHITGTTEYFHLFAHGNWLDSNKNGVFDPSELTNFKTATLESSPYDYPSGTNALNAQDALEHVITHAGASLVRDAVDELLIEQLRSHGTQGRIIDTEDDNDIVDHVGVVATGSAPTDTDRDGMPDAWETSHGLSPTAADANGDDDADGYTNVEEYLSCLAAGGTCGTN